MTDNIILIGKWRTLEMISEDKWVDGELIPGGVIGSINCILNPMSSKMLKNFESGQYTMQDYVAYSKEYLEGWENGTVIIADKRGVENKYKVDDMKEWDDSDLVKYILKRVLDGQ